MGNGDILNYEHIEELDQYFEEIKKYRSLTRKEEKELAKKIKDGSKVALNKLVTHNLKFVVNFAKKYRNRGVPFSDLIAEGNMGLIRAAEKFDGEKDNKFISYAVWWVKNSILECINKYAVANEVKSDDYVFVNCSNVITDDNLINEEFENNLVDMQSRQSSISELMECLKDRERKILTLFYGLNGGKEMTLDEVGQEMNLTMERVRQIKDDAINKLRCEVLTLDSEDFKTLKSLR